MSRLDDALRQSLRREDPGPEFTRRVLARAAASRRPPMLRWIAVGLAASLLLAAGGLEYQRRQRIQAEGQAAKQQLVLALRIAGSKLHAVQARILEVSR